MPQWQEHAVVKPFPGIPLHPSYISRTYLSVLTDEVHPCSFPSPAAWLPSYCHTPGTSSLAWAFPSFLALENAVDPTAVVQVEEQNTRKRKKPQLSDDPLSPAARSYTGGQWKPLWLMIDAHLIFHYVTLTKLVLIIWLCGPHPHVIHIVVWHITVRRSIGKHHTCWHWCTDFPPTLRNMSKTWPLSGHWLAAITSPGLPAK